MPYKLSYYTIFSEPIDEKNSRIVFSSRTSRTMQITSLCYDFIQNGLFDNIPEVMLNKLIEHNVVVDQEENELKKIIEENQASIFEGTNKTVLYEVIQPTAYCQLGCYYCGQQHTKTNLSDNLVIKVVERIVDKFHKGNYPKGIYIGWFGGEPLIGLPQMRIINNLLREKLGNEVSIKGKVVTNGLSLKENIFLELVNDFKIDQIEITLDGTAEYHDNHRYTKKNNGKSFDIIYNNILTITAREDFKDYKCAFTIRCNVDEKNVDGVVPLIHKLADDGLHKKIAYLYFAAIYSWGGNDAHKKALTKEEHSKLQLEWFVLKTKLGFHSNHGVPHRKKQTCIAVGGPSEMYDAYGNVFNCTELSYTDFYDNTSYNLGNLKNDHLAEFSGKPFNNWNAEILEGKQEPCQKCRLLPVCGGSCPKSWKEGNMSCPSFKYNLKKDLELRYIIKKTSPDLLNEKLDHFTDSLNIAQFERIT